MEGGGSRVHLTLPPEATSVPAARHALREWLGRVGQPELSDDVELAVTEVVTNALVHAATPVDLTARLDAGTVPPTVRVEVADGSAHLPRLRDAGSASGTGRGLRLLDRIVTRWGAERHADATGRDGTGADEGKVVWFELGPTRPGEVGHAGDVEHPADGPAPTADEVRITLLDVPLLLLTAWREHTGSLLREHLLVRLESTDAEEALARHAAAGEVLAMLDEQWPRRARHRDPDELLAASVEPHVTVARMEMRLPPDAVQSFAVLEEVVEEALDLADRGELLTAPTQPEMRTMRRWLVTEVLRQAEGDPPTPHAFGSGELPGAPLDLSWDPSAVDGAAHPCLATDSENRIVAASDAALGFLGYDRGLVGRRLLRIIPARFHQAHLAGFSLHLVNDRGPLIGVPIVVPFRCADDQERLAELLITVDRSGDGRRVYVGDLRPVAPM